MIKLPKEVNVIFKKFESASKSIYAVGGCVRDSLLGATPYDWDLTTDATLEEMKELLPTAKVISEKYRIVRIDLTDDDGEGLVIDVAAMRVEEEYDEKGRPAKVEFVSNIEEDLARRDFTINAIADCPSKTVIDPYKGREDIKKKIIRSIGDPMIRYKEDPTRMLRAVRLAAQHGFDLSKADYEAIIQNADGLKAISKDRIREEFEDIIVSSNAGRGLRMLAGADLMPAIIGDVAEGLSNRQRDLFSTLADNIDETQQNLERRLGLFYLCFEEKKGLKAVELLNYDNETKQHLVDGLKLIDKIHFLRNGIEIKGWLNEYGEERFNYVHNLSKAQRIVYDYSEIRIQSRNYILNDIKVRKEPVYIEDLAINGQDLIDEGIADGEKIGQILNQLLDVVHRRPDNNKREYLLETARKFSKNPLIAATRKVKWLK